MKIFVKLLLLLTSFSCFSQKKIPIDSVGLYIVSDSILAHITDKSQYIEFQNTELGLVIYQPKDYILKWSINRDTLTEKIGFEYSNWKIVESDSSNKKSVKLKGVCTESWPEEAYAIFEFELLDSLVICYKRTIHLNNENQDQIVKETLISNKSNLRKLVCIREPNQHYPGTCLPFIQINKNYYSIAKKEDFEYE